MYYTNDYQSQKNKHREGEGVLIVTPNYYKVNINLQITKAFKNSVLKSVVFNPEY